MTTTINPQPAAIDLDRVTVRDLARAARALHLKPSDLYPLLPVPEPITTPAEFNPFSRGDGLQDTYGHCAPWCFYPRELTEDDRAHGHTVEDHGVMCRRAVGYIESVTAEGGGHPHGSVSLTEPYFHGTYEPGQVDRSSGCLVELDFDPDGDDGASKHYLTVGETRRMIAILQRAVDELDGLHQTLSRR